MVMVQETSLAAFLKIQEDGTLGKMELEVYDCIKDNPGLTDAELTVELGYKRDFNKVRPRRNGCVKKGWVVETDKRVCTINNMMAKCWKVVK